MKSFGYTLLGLLAVGMVRADDGPSDTHNCFKTPACTAPIWHLNPSQTMPSSPHHRRDGPSNTSHCFKTPGCTAPIPFPAPSSPVVRTGEHSSTTAPVPEFLDLGLTTLSTHLVVRQTDTTSRCLKTPGCTASSHVTASTWTSTST